MHDLVGIAAEDEGAGVAQQGQNELELDIGQVLDLVDDEKIVPRLRPLQVREAYHVDVVE